MINLHNPFGDSSVSIRNRRIFDVAISYRQPSSPFNSIQKVCGILRALGANVEEYPDGLFVPGQQRLHEGVVDSFGDHRIAMAFAVAGLFAEGPVTIKDPGCVAISFPQFFETLQKVRA